MTAKENESFFASPQIEKYPEVGSRLFFQLCDGNEPSSAWQIVQDDVYAYLIASQMGRLSVRLVIANFLAAEIIWDDNDSNYGSTPD